MAQEKGRHIGREKSEQLDIIKAHVKNFIETMNKWVIYVDDAIAKAKASCGEKSVSRSQ